MNKPTKRTPDLARTSTSTIEDKLRRQIDILIQHYGAEAKGHLYSKRKAIREPYLDKIMAIITTETTKARKQAASDIFTLAHKYAQNDNTMVGSEELRAYHYYNALHKIGEFSGR